MKKTALVLTAVLGLMGLPTLAQAASSFMGLGYLPGGTCYSSQANGVSADGSVVVGRCDSPFGIEAFRWTQAGGMVGLGHLADHCSWGLPFSEAAAVSTDGSVVVGQSCSTLDNQSRYEAFHWTQAGGMVGLGGLLGALPNDSFLSMAKDVSADGSVVVGTSSSILVTGRTAFHWTQASGMVALPGGYANAVSPDGLVVVGGTLGDEAFRWTQTDSTLGLGDLPGGSFSSVATAVSADGSVVVGRGNSSFGDEAFRWTQAGGMVGLGDLPGGIFFSGATAVSADGSVIIGISGGAFIWDVTHGIRSLKDVLVNDYGLDLTGWVLYAAMDISADGRTIVGFGRNPSSYGEAWIARLENHLLTVTTSGSGTVTSAPAGIDCGRDCREAYPSGKTVTLTATPDSGWKFAGWSGACSGTGTCQVTMDQDRAVTATFNREFSLVVVKRGSGRVTSDPAGIDCGNDCSENYPVNTLVRLTATPISGSIFTGWSGACSGVGVCEVSMTQSRSVMATFAVKTYALTVRKAGNGSGTVSSSPSGINCGSDCSESYSSGKVVKLTAKAKSGSVFTGWSGACSGTSSACTVTMNQARTVTAAFTKKGYYLLTVSKAGNGSGTVTSSPSGINCGSDCSESYSSGKVVKLTAKARIDSVFAGWSGACSGTSSSCTVTMNQAKTVTAAFTKKGYYLLTVSKAGSGSGTVTSSPSGINCGSDCDHSYRNGTKVKLTAKAKSGSVFAGWKGSCSGRSATCQVTLSKTRAVTATFNRRSAASSYDWQEFLNPQENGGDADSAVNLFLREGSGQ